MSFNSSVLSNDLHFASSGEVFSLVLLRGALSLVIAKELPLVFQRQVVAFEVSPLLVPVQPHPGGGLQSLLQLLPPLVPRFIRLKRLPQLQILLILSLKLIRLLQ